MDSDNTSGPGQTSWYEEFTPDQRTVLVFLLAYERERKKRQYGYRVWQREDASVLRLPVYKQAATVVAWLREQGKGVTWMQKDWQGYIAYAFKHFAPKIPFIGQLKNKKLLKLYRTNGFKREMKPVMTRKELIERYRRTFRQEFASDDFLRAMGVRRFDDNEDI